MELPRFPRHADVIAEDARRWQRLSVGERLDRIFAFAATTQSSMTEASRAAHRQAKARSLEEWRLAHKRAIEHYERIHGTFVE